MPVTLRRDPAAIAGMGASGAGGKPQFVTKDDFKAKVLDAPGPVAVEFMSYACGDCRRADPMINDVADALQGKVTVFKVNVPKEKALSDKFGIYSTPTLIMFRNGREVGRELPDINISDIRASIVGAFDDVR